MSANNAHLASGMERERRLGAKLVLVLVLVQYYYYHFGYYYYYYGQIAEMCVRGACMTLPAPSLPLLLGTVLR